MLLLVPLRFSHLCKVMNRQQTEREREREGGREREREREIAVINYRYNGVQQWWDRSTAFSSTYENIRLRLSEYSLCYFHIDGFFNCRHKYKWFGRLLCQKKTLEATKLKPVVAEVNINARMWNKSLDFIVCPQGVNLGGGIS